MAERREEHAKKAENDPKPQGNRVVRYFKEVRDELRKVEWPKRKDVYRGTIIVIALSVIIAVLLGAFDYAFTFALERALEIF